MNGLLVVLILGLLFYFMHRAHGKIGGCGTAHHRKKEPQPGTEVKGEEPASTAPPRAKETPRFAKLLVWTLLLLVPLMLLHSLIPAGSQLHSLLFWAALLLPLIILPFISKTGKALTSDEAEAGFEGEKEDDEARWREQRLGIVGTLQEHVAREMRVEATRYDRDTIIFEGRLRAASDDVYRRLRSAFAELNQAPQLLEGERGQTIVVAAPISPEERQPLRQNFGLAIVLFAATLVTTMWAGALHQGVNLWQDPTRFAVGLPYSLALMAILLVHELGHYVAGRLHGIKVTLPYFIPIPMGLGTFGAFIQIRGAIPDRRKLFDVGAAGPLAGLVIALPALYFGLKGASVASSGTGVSLSSSVILTWLYSLSNTGPVNPEHLVLLSPLGFAGWLGLLVTALNLIPVGQLDGGHIAYALLGRRHAETLGWVAFFLLLTLGIFYWSGWLTWAILIFFLAGVKHEPALNELTALGWRRRLVGAFAFVLLFLIMAPVPHRFMDTLGVTCPYVGTGREATL